MAGWRPAVVLVTSVTLLAGGCGSDRTGGPKGAPEAVVRSAPDLTFAAGSASVEASAADAQSNLRADFAGPVTTARPRGPGASKNYPELTDPLAVVDLVRGAVAIEPYGGVSVRGVSTFRYEVVVNVERAVRSTPPDRQARVSAFAQRLGSDVFYADVWIDAQGRLRRVQVPVDKSSKRPGNRDRTMPALVTVDLFDYEGDDG